MKPSWNKLQLARIPSKGLSRIVLATLVAGLALAGGRVPLAHAATFTVNSTVDAVDAIPGDGVCETAPSNGVCTLRAAIQEVNALAGDDTVNVPAGAYTLTIPGAEEDGSATGDLDITSNLTINGAGADTTIIDGNRIDRVLHLIGLNTTVSIFGVTIANGNADICCDFDGGGILNKGMLTITNSTVSGNSAVGSGGGILNNSTLTITSSTISSNSAILGEGGGVWNGDMLTITNSTISGNSAGASGSAGGGGIRNNVGTVELNNTTVFDNAANRGGGILDAGGSTVNVRNTIIAGNTATTSEPDVRGPFFSSLGNNLIGVGTASGFIDGVNGDIVGTSSSPIDPLLGPLQNNGGPTDTHALLAGSPAIDAGNPGLPGSGGNACEETDQRGVARPQGVACDIGAYEAEEATPAPTPLFTAFPEQEVVEGWEWPVGEIVHLAINDPSNGPAIDFEANGTVELAPWDGVTPWLWIEFAGEYDMKPGDLVTLSDGVTERTHTVRNLAITSFNPEADTVAGTADPGETVYVWPYETGEQVQATADASGAWQVDFTGVFDLEPGTDGRSEIRDEMNNSTAVDWRALNSRLQVQITDNWFVAQDWLPGSEIEFAIYESLGGNLLWGPVVKPADENGEAFVARWEHGIDLLAGHYIVASDSTTAKDLVLEPIVFGAIDLSTGHMYGTAPDAEDGRLVWLGIGFPNSGWEDEAITDADGNWFAEFGGPVPLDFEWIAAQVFDADGDVSEVRPSLIVMGPSPFAFDILTAKTKCGADGQDQIRIGGTVESFDPSADLTIEIGSEQAGIFGPFGPLTIPAGTRGPVEVDGGKVKVTLPEDGTGEFQINVDALGLNDCTRDETEAKLTLSLNGAADTITLERKTDSKFHSIDFFTSGTVFDYLGNPLAGIHVDIEEGGVGVCTDENGFWSIEGLTPGSYDMVAGRPFCDPHPYAEQVIAGVVAGTSGNDFYLSIGFFTTGTVFDDSGNPLPLILVDLVVGGVGVCTDDNGFWRIEGLDPGSHDMVAGRRFCDAEYPPFETVIMSVVAGTSGNNFTLVIP